jgi:hypothetical protein
MTPTRPRRLRRALNWSLADGLLYAVMVGVSESYLGAFAVELGHGPTALAVLTTAPFLVGALSQFATPALSAALGGGTRLVVLGSAVQALSHLGFYAVAVTGDDRLWTLMSAKIAFWVSGSIIGPAWGAWMAGLLRGPARPRYFARRSGAVHAVLVVAFAGAGWFLHHTGSGPRYLGTFALLFLVALVARLGSSTALALQSRYRFRVQGHTGTFARVRLALRGARWRVAGYLAAVMFGAHIAVPFFTPYMLRDLGLDYGAFAALSSVSILAKAIGFAACARVARAVGLRPLLLAGGFGVATVPLFWAFSRDMGVLVTAQIVGGLAWAAVEFTGFQLLLQSAHPRFRLEFMSMAGALSGGAQVLGAVLGGQLLSRFAVDYTAVFFASAAGRGMALVLLVAIPAAMIPTRLPWLLTRLISVRPVGGGIERAVAGDESAAMAAEPDQSETVAVNE